MCSKKNEKTFPNDFCFVVADVFFFYLKKFGYKCGSFFGFVVKYNYTFMNGDNR